MRNLRLVIDTNVFLVSLAPKFNLNWIFKYLIQGRFDLCITTEILHEYQEIISKRYGIDSTNATLDFLLLLPNVHQIIPHFKWDLLADADDNKFIDCAIAGSADYIIRNDKDFNILNAIDFPPIKKLTSQEFEIQFKEKLS